VAQKSGNDPLFYPKLPEFALLEASRYAYKSK
jgi:hypothetical protein